MTGDYKKDTEKTRVLSFLGVFVGCFMAFSFKMTDRKEEKAKAATFERQKVNKWLNAPALN